MAFEDRFSPATSPNSGDVQNFPDSPESSRTSPYTCQIIQQKSSIFRISTILQQSETDTDPSSLKYSIHNILQPDFGKNALQRTKASSIGFKPYESASTSSLGSLCQAVSQIGRAASPTVSDAGKRADSSPVPLPSPSPKEEQKEDKIPQLWPAWVYCTRYSDRPSSGPRSRRAKKPAPKAPSVTPEEKRPRTAFSGAQLARLKHEFAENRYLTERRRQQLSGELGLNEAQIKIWFQNKRAKIKKASGQKNPLALQLMAQGLYNHSTVACDEDELMGLQAMGAEPQGM